MTVGLDTSVVLRLLMGAPEEQAIAALAWVRAQRAGGVIPSVSDLVVCETYFALQHHFRVPKEEALSKLAAFLESGHVAPDGVAASVLATQGLATAKPGFVDRVIHDQYLRAGADGMVTFERAAQRLKRVRVLGAESGPSSRRRSS